MTMHLSMPFMLHPTGREPFADGSLFAAAFLTRQGIALLVGKNRSPYQIFAEAHISHERIDS